MFPELCRAVSTYSDPLHSSSCHTPVSPVPRCVSSFVSTRLRQCSTRRFAYPPTEQTSVGPEWWCAAHFSANKHDHVSSLLRDFHWLRAPQRIDYKIAVLVYRCLHGLAPAYLSVDLRSIKDLSSRQRLRSLSSDMLAVPTSKLSTVCDRAFPIVAARVWNTL